LCVAAGQLDAMRAAREKPRNQQLFVPTYTTHCTQPIQWPRPEIVDPTLRSLMLAKAYGEFYPVERHQPSEMGMAAAIISMLNNNIIDSNLVSAAGVMGSAMNMAGIHPVIVYGNDLATRLSEDPDVQSFIGQFHGHNRDQHHLMVGTILLGLGKQVTAEGYQGWMENHIRLFRGSLGIPEGYSVWSSAKLKLNSMV
jgi:hypothetical protein